MEHLKMKNVWRLLLITYILGCGIPLMKALPTDLERSYNEFFYSIDEEDREDFLIWQLGIESDRRSQLNPHEIPNLRVPTDLKIDQKTFSRLRKLDVPEGFSTQLYTWVKGAYGVSPPEIVKFIVTREMCVRGKCFDAGDVGSICCPF